MNSSERQFTHHPGHALRGPHAASRLSADECLAIQQWLDQPENDSGASVRDVAQFIRSFPLLERAVLGMAGSALLGGLQVSNTTHAVAMLGVRRTHWLIREALAATNNPTVSPAP